MCNQQLNLRMNIVTKVALLGVRRGVELLCLFTSNEYIVFKTKLNFCTFVPPKIFNTTT